MAVATLLTSGQENAEGEGEEARKEEGPRMQEI